MEGLGRWPATFAHILTSAFSSLCQRLHTNYMMTFPSFTVKLVSSFLPNISAAAPSSETHWEKWHWIRAGEEKSAPKLLPLLYFLMFTAALKDSAGRNRQLCNLKSALTVVYNPVQCLWREGGGVKANSLEYCARCLLFCYHGMYLYNLYFKNTPFFYFYIFICVHLCLYRKKKEEMSIFYICRCMC